MAEMNPAGDGPPVNLSAVVQSLVRKSYEDLLSQVEKLPAKDDAARKEQLLKYFKSTRIQFIRLFILLQWSSKRHVMEDATALQRFLDEQDACFRNAADSLYDIQTRIMFNSKIPIFDVVSATDVLSTGTYNRLPTLIDSPYKEIIPGEAPRPTMNAQQIQEIKQRLNTIIQVRLLRTRLPNALSISKIEGGKLHLLAKDEFKCAVTLLDGDEDNKPWTIVELELFVAPFDNAGKAFLGKQEAAIVMGLAQEKLNNARSQTPIADMYNVIHSFCMTMELDILNAQAEAIYQSKQSFRIAKPSFSNDELVINYWPDKEGRPSALKISNRPGRAELHVEHTPILTDPTTGEAAQLRIVPMKVNLEVLLLQARNLNVYMRLSQLKAKINHPSELISDPTFGSTILKVHLFDHYYATIHVDPHTGLLLFRENVDKIFEPAQLAKLTEQLNSASSQDSVQNSILHAMTVRVVQHALIQTARDLGLTASQVAVPSHFSSGALSTEPLVAPSNEELNRTFNINTSTLHHSVPQSNFLMFIRFAEHALQQFAIVAQVEMPQPVPSHSKGTSAVNTTPKVSYWLVQFRKQSQVAKDAPQGAAKPFVPKTPQTPSTPHLAATSSNEAFVRRWKILVSQRSCHMRRARIEFVDMNDPSATTPRGEDEDSDYFNDEDAMNDEEHVDIDGDDNGEPSAKKRKRNPDDEPSDASVSKKKKMTELSSSGFASRLSFHSPPPPLSSPTVSSIFTSLSAVVGSTRSKATHTLLLEQLVAAGVQYSPVVPAQSEAKYANYLARYSLDINVSPMLINQVFLTLYPAGSEYEWTVTLVEAQHLVPPANLFHNEQTPEGTISYNPAELCWTFSYRYVTPDCYQKHFISRDLKGVCFIMDMAAQFNRCLADPTANYSSPFHMLGIGLHRLSIQFQYSEDTAAELHIKWAPNSKDSCPISICLAQGEYILASHIAEELYERRSMRFFLDAIWNTFIPVRALQDWFHTDQLRVNEMNLIPVDVNRIHIRARHRHGIAISLEVRFLGGGVLSFDLIPDSKHLAQFAPYRTGHARFATASKLDKYLTSCIRAFYEIPDAPAGALEEIPPENGTLWNFSTSSGFVAHQQYLPTILLRAQPYLLAVAQLCASQKINFTKGLEICYHFQTFAMPQQQPQQPSRDFVAFVDLDDKGSFRLNMTYTPQSGLQASDIDELHELFNTHVRTNPHRPVTFASFTHLIQSPPSVINNLALVSAKARQSQTESSSTYFELSFTGGFASDQRGIVQEFAKTRIGITLAFRAQNESIAIPLIWNYREGKLDTSGIEPPFASARLALSTSSTDLDLVKQLLDALSKQTHSGIYSVVMALREWWIRRH